MGMLDDPAKRTTTENDKLSACWLAQAEWEIERRAIQVE